MSFSSTFARIVIQPEDKNALRDSRKKKNASSLKLVAATLAVLCLYMLGNLVLLEKDPWDEGLNLVYAGLFFATAVVSAGAFAWWSFRPRWGGQTAYLLFLLAAGLGLSLCDVQDSGDFSMYTLALLSSALLFSAPRPWYPITYGAAWALFLTGIAVTNPTFAGSNPAVVTAVTVIAVAVGLILESQRMKSDLLALELGRRNQELLEASYRDSLTGLHNRRFLFEWVEKQVALARRKNLPLTVVLLDLDHFKEVNDTVGHQLGDAVLWQASRWLEAAVRKSDVVARYGGEEFVLALPETSGPQAAPVMARCIEAFRAGSVPGWNKPVTFSGGQTTLRPDETVKELFQRADDLLYRAKRAGHNQIVES